MLKSFLASLSKRNKPLEREYHSWHSPALGRTMEMLSFGSKGTPVLIFPTRMARFYDYENWGMIEQLRHRMQEGDFTLYCVDSHDEQSLYNKSILPPARIEAHLKYEQYLLEELLPFIHKRHEDDQKPVCAGCSLGAWHAVNLACRYPGQFSRVMAMSGRFDLTKRLPFFDDLFDGYWDDSIYYQMPIQYLPNLADETILNQLRQLEFLLVVGIEDAFLESNRELAHSLQTLQIPHTLLLRDGEAHKARYWGEIFRLVL